MSKRRNSKTRERSTGPLPPKVSKKKAVSNIHTEITSTTRKYFKTPGVVLTLGEGDVGQLGLDPDISPRSRPTLLPDLQSKNVVFVCAGGMHTLCLTENGTVLSFGCNDEGALGREGSEYEPLPVHLPDKVAQVAAGDSHSAALLEDGRVFAWGAFRDSHGSMGLTIAAPEQPQKVPVRIPVEGHVVKIASGADHLVMLTASGHAYTCGCGEQGQLGRVVQRSANRSSRQGLNHLLIPAPVIVKAGKKQLLVDDLWASNYCTFFKEKANGYIYACGLNNYNQLGVPNLRNTEILCEYFPKKAELLCNKSWTLITGGQHHTIALDAHGVAYALGRREYGRLGLGKDCEDAIEPTPIPALKNKKCVNVACGSCVSFAVTADGDVFAWGMGTNNQLGTGSDDDVYEPTKIQGKQLDGRKTVQVAGGGQHTVLLAV